MIPMKCSSVTCEMFQGIEHYLRGGLVRFPQCSGVDDVIEQSVLGVVEDETACAG